MREDVVVAEKLWRILILFRKRLTDRLFLLLPVIFWILPEFFAHSHSTDLLKVKKQNKKTNPWVTQYTKKKKLSHSGMGYTCLYILLHFLVKGVGMTHTNLLPWHPWQPDGANPPNGRVAQAAQHGTGRRWRPRGETGEGGCEGIWGWGGLKGYSHTLEVARVVSAKIFQLNWCVFLLKTIQGTQFWINRLFSRVDMLALGRVLTCDICRRECGLELTVMAGPEASDISAPEKNLHEINSSVCTQKITKTFRYVKWRCWPLIRLFWGVGFPLYI